MSNLMTREDVLKAIMVNVAEGDFILQLLKNAEELGYGSCLDTFSLLAQEYVSELISQKDSFKIDKIYTYMMNVCYVIELYLRGYYNNEDYMGYEEFINLVKAKRVREVIDLAHNAFMKHIKRLKDIILKARRKIPLENFYFSNTEGLLKQIDKDLRICERYPTTSANLSTFYFGKYYENCGTNLVDKMTGFLNLEKEVYSLRNEVYILSRIDIKYIEDIANQYIENVGASIPFNLFEKVINNYLFALVYSEEPETLKISKVDAELLIREIKLGTLSAEELVNQLIDRLKLSGYRAEYLKEYGVHLQKRIDALKDSNYFGELFLVTL